MAVFKKNGMWWIDFYLTDGRRKRECISSNKRLAESVFVKRKLEVREGRYFEKQEIESVPFRDFAVEYLEYCKPRKRSWTRDETSLVSLKKEFENKTLDGISIRDVEVYQTKRAKKVARSTVDRELITLSALFSAAVRWGKAASNPVKSVKKFRPKSQRVRFLTHEEADKLLSKCAEHIRPIVVTALNTGMRKQEILHLRWSDVDLRTKVIHVGTQMEDDGSPATKSKKTRTIPMNAILTRTLKGLRMRKIGEHVFADGNGQPFGDIKKGYNAAVRRAEIEDLHFHDLRHTFASHLVMSGVGVKVLQELLGHSSLEMTMRYAHLSPEHRQEAVEKLSFGENVVNDGHLYGHQTGVSKKTLAVSA